MNPTPSSHSTNESTINNNNTNSTTTSINTNLRRSSSISKRRRSSPYSISIPPYALEQVIIHSNEGTSSTTSSPWNSRKSSLFAEEEGSNLFLETTQPSPRIASRRKSSIFFNPVTRKNSAQVPIDALGSLSIEGNNNNNTTTNANPRLSINIGDSTSLMESTLGLLATPQTPVMSSLSVTSSQAPRIFEPTPSSSYTNSVINTPSTANTPFNYIHNREMLLQNLDEYRFGETNDSYVQYELGDHISDRKIYKKLFGANATFLKFPSRSNSAQSFSSCTSSIAPTTLSSSEPSASCSSTTSDSDKK